MEILNAIGVMSGASWASGINLYMTVAGLGIAQRLHWITLPGDMSVLSHPLVIAVAVALYAVEFVVDKIPLLDSAWDSVHTFIRPVGGAALGYMAAAGMGPAAQIPVALLTGTVSLDAHLTKATGRAAINSTAPVPGVGAVASLGEDGAVLGVFYLMMKHPVIAAVLIILFIAFSIWFLRLMFRFLKKVFRFLLKSGGDESLTQGGRS